MAIRRQHTERTPGDANGRDWSYTPSRNTKNYITSFKAIKNQRNIPQRISEGPLPQWHLKLPETQHNKFLVLSGPVYYTSPKTQIHS